MSSIEELQAEIADCDRQILELSLKKRLLRTQIRNMRELEKERKTLDLMKKAKKRNPDSDVEVIKKKLLS